LATRSCALDKPFRKEHNIASETADEYSHEVSSAPSLNLLPSERLQSLSFELEYALSSLSVGELVHLATIGLSYDAISALSRRLKSAAATIALLVSGSYIEIAAARTASKNGTLPTHISDRANAFRARVLGICEQLDRSAKGLVANPRVEIPKLVIAGLCAVVASGGVDGNGGAPDLDLALGIGAHRSPFTHSIAMGAAIEALVLLSVKLIDRIHANLPVKHDPIWDELAQGSSAVLNAAGTGASVGIAYHLMVDGLVQPGAYHGLPVEMPLWAHQALLTGNGLAEAVSASRAVYSEPVPPDLVALHKKKLAEKWDLDPELRQLLGPDVFDQIRTRGAWMHSLSTGVVPPISPAQVHFIGVAWGKEEASSLLESCWVRFINVHRVAHFVDGRLRRGHRTLSGKALIRIEEWVARR
jgi:hypothetical protein